MPFRPHLVPALVLVLVTVASLLPVASARASQERVVVIDSEPRLVDAIGASLSPWGLRVVAVRVAAPGVELESAKQSARALATAQDAGAVVWLAAAAGERPSLWLYDATTEQMTVRPLAQAPPFDAAAAAAVALSVKTLLRSTAMAPAPERTAAAQGASESADAAAPAPALAPPHVWRLAAYALAQAPTGTGAAAAARAGLEASAWPGRWQERLGVAVGVTAGPSIGLASRSFVGSFSDTAVEASVRARLGPSSLSTEIGPGASLHVTSLSGAAIANGHHASVLRADPALDLLAVPQVAVGRRMRLGLAVEVSALLRTQRYALESDLVLRLPPVVVDLGGRVSFALD